MLTHDGVHMSVSCASFPSPAHLPVSVFPCLSMSFHALPYLILPPYPSLPLPAFPSLSHPYVPRPVRPPPPAGGLLGLSPSRSYPSLRLGSPSPAYARTHTPTQPQGAQRDASFAAGGDGSTVGAGVDGGSPQLSCLGSSSSLGRVGEEGGAGGLLPAPAAPSTPPTTAGGAPGPSGVGNVLTLTSLISVLVALSAMKGGAGG